jgi:sialidase-1
MDNSVRVIKVSKAQWDRNPGCTAEPATLGYGVKPRSGLPGFAKLSGVIVTLAAAALVIAAPAAEAQSRLPAQLDATSVVFESPQGDFVTTKEKYHTFRIPGMVVAQDGAVLVFAEGRRGTGRDPRTDKNAPIDLVMRRSTDHGRTWGPLVVIDSGFRPNGDKMDFADPTPVLDQRTGTIFLVYGQWPDSGKETVAVGQHKVWVRSSRDHGQTWSDPSQVKYATAPTETSDKTYWRQAEPGPGNGIQLRWQDADPARNGRLVIPAKRSGSTTPTGAVTVRPFVYYSDDHGVTWRVGGVTSGPDANEDEVVELVNGRLLLDARQEEGPFRRRHLSSDGGEGWGANVPDDLAITTVDASMNRYSSVRDGHDRDRILFSAPRGKGNVARANLTIWTSYDEGKSFINPVQFTDEGSAYSVVERLADGTIGVLVETADKNGKPYGDISFYNVGIEHLEGGTHPKARTHCDGFENAIDPLRGGIGWSGGWRNSGAVVEAGSLPLDGDRPSRDDHHAYLRGASISRDLGTGALNLDANQNYFLALLVRREGEAGAAGQSGSLEVSLQDAEGAARGAFGVDRDSKPFARVDGQNASGSEPAMEPGKAYLIVAKLAARDDSQPGKRDRMFVKCYNDMDKIPSDESHVKWRLTSESPKNVSGVIKSLQIAADGSAGWRVDEIRLGTNFESVMASTVNAAVPR